MASLKINRLEYVRGGSLYRIAIYLGGIKLVEEQTLFLRLAEIAELQEFEFPQNFWVFNRKITEHWDE